MRPLGLVLDTVEALAQGALREESATALRAVWKRVYEGEDVRDAMVADASGTMLAPALTARASSRGGPYPLMLIGPHWRLFVSAERGRARVVVDARFLAEHGAPAARVELARIAWWLYGEAAQWRLSRLDIACDVAALEVAPFAELQTCVTRCAGKSIIYEDGERERDEELSARVHVKHAAVQTVTLGSASSRVQLCAYDKVAEVRHSEKTWQLDVARARGWNEGETLTRVEFRLRGKGLEEFTDLGLVQLSALDKSHEWMPKLWAYFTAKSVRYTTGMRGDAHDANRSRWTTLPWWQTLQDVGEKRVPERTRGVAESAREERARRAARDLIRGAVAMVAENASVAYSAQQACIRAMDDGSEHAPETLVIAQALAAAGDLLGLRALGSRDIAERARELKQRIERRRAHVAYSDSPWDAWEKAA